MPNWWKKPKPLDLMPANRSDLFTRSTTLLLILFSVISSFGQQYGWDDWKSANASQVSNLPAIGLAGQSAVLYGDRLFVLGGTNFPEGMPWIGGAKRYHPQLWAYKIGRNGKLTSTDIQSNYPFPIAYAASVLFGSSWIIIGGESDGRQVAQVFAIDLKQRNTHFTPLPELPLPLANAQAMVIGQTIHVVGGETGSATSGKHFTLDMQHQEKGWQLLGTLPYPVSHAVLLKDELNMRYLLAGGRAKQKEAPSRFYASSLVFDQTSGKWTKDNSLPFPLAAGTGISFQDGTMLLFGGDTGAVFNQVENCMLQAANATSSDSISAWNKRRIDLQSNHPGFSRSIVQYDRRKGEWVDSGMLPFQTPVTTAAVRNNRYLVIPGGEIRAGVRTSMFYIHKLSGQ